MNEEGVAAAWAWGLGRCMNLLTRRPWSSIEKGAAGTMLHRKVGKVATCARKQVRGKVRWLACGAVEQDIALSGGVVLSKVRADRGRTLTEADGQG